MATTKRPATISDFAARQQHSCQLSMLLHRLKKVPRHGFTASLKPMSLPSPTSTLVSPDKLVPDYLDHIALDYLALLLRTFHGVIKHSPCKAEYLEELFWQALKHRYPLLDVGWQPGNHTPFKDIDIREIPPAPKLHVPVSVKSGVWDRSEEFLTISGPRVQRILGARGGHPSTVWEQGGQRLVDHLNGEHRQIVSFAAAKPHDAAFPGNIVYDVCCLKPDIFDYPNAEDWAVCTGTGGAATVECKLPSGVIVTLRPSMSYQVWWKIPAKAVTRLRKISIV